MDFPDYAADRIPPTILIPLIVCFQNSGLREVWTIKVDRFSNSGTRPILLRNRDQFKIYHEIEDAKALRLKNGIEILLPDYDCPYSILSASKETCSEIVKLVK